MLLRNTARFRLYPPKRNAVYATYVIVKGLSNDEVTAMIAHVRMAGLWMGLVSS